GFELDHPGHQQERVAVREQLPDAIDADRQGQCLAHSSPSFLSRAATFLARASRCRKRAAFLRHSRFSISGVPEEYSPGSRIEPVTRLIAVTVTRSQISMWPTM